VLVFARTAAAHRTLNLGFDAGEPRKVYLAIVRGVPEWSALRVDVPIAKGRKGRMRPGRPGEPEAKASVTAFQVLERFPAAGLALVEARPETGRTHQIRVHLAHARHPLVGDPVYGVRPRPPKGCDPALTAAIQQFPRQALHAFRLGILHPRTGLEMAWEAPLPPDLTALLDLFRRQATLGPDQT
jgi:23S rRNA-/tRNA-specific pseudouridylate synthase